jgi:membrane protein DedA with SNARE-associated domain
MIDTFVHAFVNLIDKTGYDGIFLLMTLESSFLPFPSEIVMIPAGYLISQNALHPFITLFAASSGCITGAMINYTLSYFLGRRLVIKYGKYFLIQEKHIIKAEKFVKEHGSAATFIARLIPGIRQMMSIPAGLMRMNLKPFIFYTFLGASIWNITLLLVGYFIGNNENMIKESLPWIILAALSVSFIITTSYIALYQYRKKK